MPSSVLGQVNLISRLSSRVTKKFGAGGRILFYDFYFPEEKTSDDNFVFINKKGVISCPNMFC
jgi:hypothetical protein